MRALVRTLLIAVASMVVLAACGTNAEPYAAKVNGNRIETKDLDRELNAIASNKAYLKALEEASVPVQGEGKGTFDSAFVARVLTRRIYLELVHQEMVKRNLAPSKDDLTEARKELVQSIGNLETLAAFADGYENEIVRTTAEVNVLRDELGKIDDSPAGVKRFYDAHPELFETVCASHILVAEKAEADAIAKQLATAKDKKAAFAKLAAEKSTDPGSKEKGGDLGCATPSGYVPTFREAVRTQPIGVIGKPVQTQFGYHVVRVDSRTPPPPLAAIQEQVASEQAKASQSGFDDFLSTASAEAKIEVNPKYGRVDRSGTSPQVVPNDSPSTTQAPVPANPTPQPPPGQPQ